MDALADGFARTFLIGAFIAIAGIVMALLLRRPTATAAARRARDTELAEEYERFVS